MSQQGPHPLTQEEALSALRQVMGAALEPDAEPPIVVMARAVSIPDPADRAAAITDMLARCQQVVEWLSVHRDTAIREMRDSGSSYDRVAQVLGVHKSRAQQICRRLGGRSG